MIETGPARTTSVYEVISPETGISYTLTAGVVEDACGDCGGKGVIYFSTIADLRKFINERNAREEDADPYEEDDYHYEPERSAHRQCERCGGTGHFKGDGGLYTFKMSTTLFMAMRPPE